MNGFARSSMSASPSGQALKVLWLWLATSPLVLAASAEELSTIHFSASEIQVQGTESDTTIPFSLTLENLGPKMVTIDHILTGCSCVHAEMDKTSYSPGERGALFGQFIVGEHSGPQLKIIRIFISLPEPIIIEIPLVISLPKGPVISDRVLVWPKDGEMAERFVSMKIPIESRDAVISVSVDKEDFQARLLGAGHNPDLLFGVKPMQNKAIESGIVTITTKFHVYHIFALMAEPPAASSP